MGKQNIKTFRQSMGSPSRHIYAYIYIEQPVTSGRCGLVREDRLPNKTSEPYPNKAQLESYIK